MSGRLVASIVVLALLASSAIAVFMADKEILSDWKEKAVGVFEQQDSGKNGAKKKPSTLSQVEAVTKTAQNPASPYIADITILERRPPVGKTCAAVHFGGMGAVTEPVPLDSDGKARTSALSGLCGLSFVVDVGETARYIAVYLDVRSGKYIKGAGKPGAFNGVTSFSGHQTWSIDLPRSMRVPFEYRVIALVAERPVGKDAGWLRKQAAWESAVNLLSERGIKIYLARHKVTP